MIEFTVYKYIDSTSRNFFRKNGEIVTAELNVSIIIIAIVVSLYIAASNIVRRFKFLENKALVLICLLGAFQFLLLLFQFVYYHSPFLTLVCRLYYSVVLIMCVLIYGLIQIYPKWNKRPIGPGTIALMLPGLIFAVLIVPTDYVIVEVHYEGTLKYVFGFYVIFYYILQFAYFVGTFIVLIIKNKNEQNESFKRQFTPFLMGISVFGFLFTMSFMALPFYFNIHDFTPFGVASFWLALFIMLNYSLGHVLLLNYKRLYLKVVLWLIVFFAMFIPANMILREGLVNGLFGITNLTISSSVLIPVLFFAIFWSTQPIARYLANLNYIKLDRDFNRFYKTVEKAPDINEREMAWDYPLNREIDILVEHFQINNAFFYIYDSAEKTFIRTHYSRAKAGPGSIPEEDDMIKCLKEYGKIIERSMFFADEKLWKYRDTLFPFFKEHNIEIAIPIVNLDNDLSAVLFLSRFNDGSLFTREFIEHLESFGGQFGFTLVKCVTFETARRIQAVEHDKMVIGSIKKRVIPSCFDKVEGLRLSSLFIDNSEFGGDYFDSVKIDDNRAGIYIANTFDAGMNSSMLALQMYSILHGHAARYDSPERLLNLMNQAVATARYSTKHATAFYLIYSAIGSEVVFTNAAYNPLLVFNTDKDTFSEYSTEGIPLGVDGMYNYKSQSARLSPDTIGLLYSDGISSAVDKNGNAYSVSRIMDVVRMNKSEPPAALVRLIYEDFKNFTEGSPLVNDASLIVFRVV